MTTLALLRHFPTGWNRAGRLQGQTDIPLLPESLAALAGLRLPPPWDSVPRLASPLSRARVTAEALGGPVPVATDPRLREMDFGRWEGALGASLLADPASGYRAAEAWGWDFVAPGGEGPRALAARLRPLLADLAGAGPRLIVTHRGVIRCILALATGWDHASPPPFALKNRALHPVTLGPDGTPVAIAPPLRLLPR